MVCLVGYNIAFPHIAVVINSNGWLSTTNQSGRSLLVKQATHAELGTCNYSVSGF